MDPTMLSLISAGVGGAIKVASSLFDDTASRQADLLRQQAQLKLGALEETTRRAEGAQTQVLSSTKARMAGTGFSSDSNSFTNYLSAMGEQFQAQTQYTKEQGVKAISAMDDAATLLDSTSTQRKMLGALGGLFGSGTSIAETAKLF